MHSILPIALWYKYYYYLHFTDVLLRFGEHNHFLQRYHSGFTGVNPDNITLKPMIVTTKMGMEGLGNHNLLKENRTQHNGSP